MYLPYALFITCLGQKSYCACAVSRDLRVGVKSNHIFVILDPILHIHYTTFRGLRWRLRVVCSWASPSSHFYADDVQLYVSCRRGHRPTTACANRVSVCTEDINRWMASNRLVVNPAKTDVLWCSSSQPPPDTPLLPAGTTVQPSASVRNLGVLFDTDLSAHVNQLTARCYSSLRRIKSCRRALTRSASVILVNSFIVSRLDYCNSLLAGCNKQLVDQLQRVLNCAARRAGQYLKYLYLKYVF